MLTKDIVIKPNRNPLAFNLKELWNFRELFYTFAWRDIKVRYKQTFLGILWAIIQPVLSTFIFTVFFGNLAKVPSGDLPYSLFVFTGLVYWNFFSSSLTNAASSLISNEGIINKIYFPRLILPLSSVVTGAVDFFINLILLIIASFYFGFPPSLFALFIIPLGFLITFIAASGLGILLSSINIKYRDVRYIVPFFIQLLIYLSPVIYPTSILKESNRLIMALNPMTGVIEAVRSTISNTLVLDWTHLSISVIAAIILFLTGIIYFRNTEKFFADLI
jgi:lipopolysaccharide transport system permease protein